jgi:diadenosine tetraphosphatase ApaH/serine/threonine PP2A family protein phosphatase
MQAILSDIHGNLEALQAVLADAARFSVDEIYCLGDTVGYGGPNPRECLDLAMQWDVVLLGNFDEAIKGDPPEFGSQFVNNSLRWGRRELEAAVPDREAALRRWAFLRVLEPRFEAGDFLFVHGSARNPLNEYVFPEDVYNQRKMERIFPLVKRYCFQGHTHIPGIFTQYGNYLCPEEVGLGYRLNGRKALCNVGSVGQPRDGDPRACYVLLDGGVIRFRRVDYDVETTVRKLRGIF